MKLMQTLSRIATYNSHGENSSYFQGWQEYEKNPYDDICNPEGIIQMGLAENQLSLDLLESWLASHQDALGLKQGGKSIFKELALFQDYHGLPAFKNALTDFMTEMRGNKVLFDPNKLILTAGATSANETLMFCLANAGEAFLVPTPYYPGFDRDVKWRTGVELVPIHCTSSNGFKITQSALDEAYQRATKQKLHVKGVLITNPSNPLGTTMTKDELDLIVNFIDAKGLHVISDEIYSGTVFNSLGFTGALEHLIDRNLKHNEVWTRVHIVYSLSKDLGIPGFRVGAIYSNDNQVVAAATKMSSFGLVSSQTQFLLSSMLSDRKFTSKYIVENQKRLQKRREMLVSGLSSAGIRCLQSTAGLFCWVDMRHLLSSKTIEAEMVLWKKILFDVRLNISPGSSCHCAEPGWFRVCFANISEDTLSLSIKRIKAFINNNSRHHKPGRHSRTMSLPKWVFRLSYSQEREPER
ncbi:hypothetical protein Sjap_017858 [Stephania japonica]|uniref:1-aminocyclopropane-1-carboxylate synthase n=1 Tax=Stephania japonica TaxID=461633 RepID=A0AAP0I6Y0_9MAGN